MPTTTPKLQIGSVSLVGGEYAGKTWTQSLGIEAPKIAWDFPVADATILLAGPQEVTIQMVASDGTTKTIQRVYVVGEEHSPDKLVRRVILSDVRFYLPFGWVRASYNLTIQSGTLRQVQADGLPVKTLPIVANIIFAPYSLKGSDDGTAGVPWNSDQVALDVISKATTGHDFPAITVRNLARVRTTFVPNNIYVDASGEAAIGQVLGALGGLDLRVADDGALEVVNAYLGAEKDVVGPIVANYSLERKGVLRFISMSNVAPRGGKILLTRRVEIRADSFEAAPGAGGDLGTGTCDDTVWGTDNTPTMINVIPVTDQSIPYPSSSNPAIQGTFVPLSRYCEAVAAMNDTQPGTPKAAVPLTRQYLLAGGGGKSASPLLSEVLDYAYSNDHGTGIGANIAWAARCNALRNFTRTLYKLNPVLSRQCLPRSIKAERVALLDAATGTKQPATVYCDYVQRPTGPGIATEDKWGWQVNSIPPNSPNTQAFPSGTKTYSDPGPYNVNPFKLSAATAAPFQVSCVDPTTGVFFISPSAQETTQIKHAADVSPGLVWGLPTTSSGTLNKGVAISMWSQAKKLLTHRLAIVFSAVPGGPNGPTSLHTYNVSVKDALARLGAPADAVTPRAPTRELRIREGITEARIPWDDDLRQQILGCFSASGTSDPSKLVPVNDAELRDFAISWFAVYMASVLDHYEGTMMVGFQPKVMPVGSLRQVQHTFDPEGKIYTTLRADGVVPVPPPENLISQASRNVLFRGIAV